MLGSKTENGHCQKIRPQRVRKNAKQAERVVAVFETTRKRSDRFENAIRRSGNLQNFTTRSVHFYCFENDHNAFWKRQFATTRFCKN